MISLDKILLRVVRPKEAQENWLNQDAILSQRIQISNQFSVLYFLKKSLSLSLSRTYTLSLFVYLYDVFSYRGHALVYFVLTTWHVLCRQTKSQTQKKRKLEKLLTKDKQDSLTITQTRIEWKVTYIILIRFLTEHIFSS